mgnify:CR=1 FL=1
MGLDGGGQSSDAFAGSFHPGPLKNLADAEFMTMDGLDWYNHRRLHSARAAVARAMIRRHL